MAWQHTSLISAVTVCLYATICQSASARQAATHLNTRAMPAALQLFLCCQELICLVAALAMVTSEQALNFTLSVNRIQAPSKQSFMLHLSSGMMACCPSVCKAGCLAHL